MKNEDDMKLPKGKTAESCINYPKCSKIYGCKPHYTSCDFAPSRYKEEIIELKMESFEVKSKCRKLTIPKYIISFPVLWRIEKLFRKVINKPAPRIPIKFSIEDPVIMHPNDDMKLLKEKKLEGSKGK